MAPTVGFEPTRPFSPLGIQSQSLKPLEYVGMYGTPNEIRTRDARMKTVWLNLLPMRAWWGKMDLNHQHPKTPDLQSGTLPITLYYPKLGF